MLVEFSIPLAMKRIPDFSISFFVYYDFKAKIDQQNYVLTFNRMKEEEEEEDGSRKARLHFD